MVWAAVSHCYVQYGLSLCQVCLPVGCSLIFPLFSLSLFFWKVGPTADGDATSTIHALAPLPLRKTLKILAGPATNPSLHSLNGPVSTPLFDHLGSSSWHSYDAALIVGLGKSRHALRRITLFVVGVLIALALVMRRRRRGAVVRGAVGTATKAWLWAGRRRREGVLYSPSISGKGTPVEESLRVLEELDIGLEKVGRGRVSVSVSPVEWAREVQGRLA